MKHFKKEELLYALARVQEEINLKCVDSDDFDKILKFIKIDKHLLTNKEYSNKSKSLIDALFIIWYETGICKDFDDEISLIIHIDKLLDILNVDRLEFISHIYTREQVIKPKYKYES